MYWRNQLAGFLSSKVEEWIKEVRSRDSGWFSLSESVNEYAHEILLRLEPNTNDPRKILSALLFKRILSAFQAVLILNERGMRTEAMVQRRGMLEGLFVLGALLKKPKIINDYINNDILRRRDVYKKIKKSSKISRKAVSNWITEEELDTKISELEIQSQGIKYLSPERFSRAADLHDLFLTDYSNLSEAAHHATKDLEKHLVIDENEDITSLVWGPEEYEPFNVLYPSVDQMLISIIIIGEMFEIETKTKIDSFSLVSQKLSTENDKKSEPKSELESG